MSTWKQQILHLLWDCYAFVQLTSPTDKLSEAQNIWCYHQQSVFQLWKWLTPKENIYHKEVSQGASFHLNVTGTTLSALGNLTKITVHKKRNDFLYPIPNRLTDRYYNIFACCTNVIAWIHCCTTFYNPDEIGIWQERTSLSTRGKQSNSLPYPVWG